MAPIYLTIQLSGRSLDPSTTASLDFYAPLTSTHPLPTMPPHSKCSIMNKCSSSWIREEEVDLITIWDEIENQQTPLSGHQNKVAYKQITKEMAWGHDHDWAQCQSKCKVLRQHFTRTWEGNCVSGTYAPTIQGTVLHLCSQ